MNIIMKDEVNIKDILLQTEIIPEKHMVCSKFISISQVKHKSIRTKSYSPTRLHKLINERKSEPG